MYYGDYGNYNSSLNRPNFNLYKATNSHKIPMEPEKISFNKSGKFEPINVPKKGMAIVTIGLPLSADAKEMVAKYITPEQEQRIIENSMSYFE